MPGQKAFSNNQPITGQYSGHVTCLDQSEARITCSRLSRVSTALTATAPVVKGSSGVKFPRADSITVNQSEVSILHVMTNQRPVLHVLTNQRSVLLHVLTNQRPVLPVLVSRLVPVKEASAPLTCLPLKATSEAVSAAPREASENGPIRGSCSGHVISVDQSEASFTHRSALWPPSRTPRRPPSPPSSSSSMLLFLK